MGHGTRLQRGRADNPEHIKVNVNVSPEQLLGDFVANLVRALSESGLDPKRLEIEVTESIFLRDASVAREALESCMALGCSVALDDFGTGYSSLGYLRKLKFSTIKVDRLFVQGAAQRGPESIAIIRAVVAMADSLGMTTTAEGVENEEEVEMICSLAAPRSGLSLRPAGAARGCARHAGTGTARSAAQKRLIEGSASVRIALRTAPARQCRHAPCRPRARVRHHAEHCLRH